MRHGLPDEKTVWSAIALAIRAPSVHNSQPWRWRVGDSSLHLYADWSRHLTATDPDGRDLIVSCGTSLHHLRVALAAMGWGTIVHHVPNPGDSSHLASVEVFERQPTEEDIPVAAAIPRRRTDRRLYSSWPVPEALLDQLGEFAFEQGAVLRSATDPAMRFRLVSAIAEADRLQGTDPEYGSELADWSGRFSGSTDGVPASAAPLSYEGYGDLSMRRFAAAGLAQPRESYADPDAGELVVLGTSSDDVVSRLHAGEAASAVLLWATSFGLATCPLSQPLEIPSIREELKVQLLDDALFPQLVLRIGWGHINADPLLATPRRPVAEIFDHLPRR
ncbi:nitroreductase family protein [Kibdelosporangium philippinense]|uniref:Nitroreductase family protein n=2 Tax=Kibdelosporangium philippinense TaxID=211113 RepID=A0ABS8Z9W1_9PSEU|nr:nitroreductase family protein [Kibdelosporangium philippinense]MCE7004639.1 nitroreductase family protein [Kibdelosporangium philippinense]